MIVGQVDVLLLSADIATDVTDGRFVVFALLKYNCFQKFFIAVTLFWLYFSHPWYLLVLIYSNDIWFNDLFINVIRYNYLCKTSRITCFGAHRWFNFTFFMRELVVIKLKSSYKSSFVTTLLTFPTCEIFSLNTDLCLLFFSTWSIFK